jgi:RHS repeat-associated protein
MKRTALSRRCGLMLVGAIVTVGSALAAAPAYRPPIPVGAREAVGAPQGSFTVTSTGDANWALPLTLPPGRNGLEPSLALSYSSRRNTTGILGRGFAVEGLSTISRCWPGLAQDGAFSSGAIAGVPPEFCLDGQRLVASSPTALELQPEFDAGTLVRIAGTRAEPVSFTVFRRNGRIERYGARDTASAGAASRVQARPIVVSVPLQVDGTGLPVAASDCVDESQAPQARTVSWLLDRVEDRYGNFLDVDYQRTIVPGTVSTSCSDPAPGAPDTVEVVPREVRWTGSAPSAGTALAPSRRVQFVYGASRQDVRTAFVAGVAVRASQRLERIDVFGPRGLVSDATRPEAKLRHYAFGYQPAVPGRRALDRLVSIQECLFDANGGSQCRDPVTLTWADEAAPDVPQFATASVLNDAADLAVDSGGQVPAFAADVYDMAVADFDGDGRDDIVYRLPARTANNQFLDLNGGQGDPLARGDWFLRRGTPAGLGPRIALPSLPSTAGGEWRFSPRALDVDGDGTAELVLYTEPLPPGSPVTGSLYTAFRLTCAATCTFTSLPNLNEIVSMPIEGWPRRSFSLQAADFDGDGQTDLIRENLTGPTSPTSTSRLGVRLGSAGGFGAPTVLTVRLPTPGAVVPLVARALDERYAIDVDGNGQADLLAATYNATTPLLNVRATPFTFSAVNAAGGFPTGTGANAALRVTTLHSADAESSMLIASVVRGGTCSVNTTLPPTRLSRFFVDMNGDGLRDSVAFSSETRDKCSTPTVLNSRLLIAANTGGGYRRAVQQLLPSSAGLNPSVVSAGAGVRTVDIGARIVDLDQDGRDDLLQVSNNLNFPHPNGDLSTRTASMIWLRSNGTAFVPTPIGLPVANQEYRDLNSRLGGFGPRMTQLGDFDGDGRVDLISPQGARLAVFLQSPQPPAAVTRIAAGPLVPVIDVKYGWAGPNTPNLYTPATCDARQVCPRKLGWVVESFAVESADFDAATPVKTTSEYAYGGARIDRGGRGFLGVERLSIAVRVGGSATPSSTETIEYSLGSSTRVCIGASTTRCAYPSAGVPSRRETRIPIDGAATFVRETLSASTLVARADGGYRTSEQRVATTEREERTGTPAVTLRSERVVTSLDGDGSATTIVRETSPTSLPLVGAAPAGQFVRTTEERAEAPLPRDAANWLIGRFATRRVIDRDPSLPTPDTVRTQSDAIEYQPGTVDVRKRTTEPTPVVAESDSVSGFTLETLVSRDTRGAVTSVRHTGSGQSRETQYEFHPNDADRIFPWLRRNALSQVDYTWSDASWGRVAALDDRNGIRATYDYDTLGRMRARTRPGDADVAMRYISPTTNGGLRVLRQSITCLDDAAAGSSCETADPAGRIFSRSDPTGRDSVTYEFDRFGNVVRARTPGAAVATSRDDTWVRDGLGRMTRRERPGETARAPRQFSTTTYIGLVAEARSERGTVTRSVVDDLGRIVERSTKDATGRDITTRFVYGHGNELRRIEYPPLPAAQAMTPAPGPLVATVSYDLNGRRESAVDPSAGAVEYRYNAFGELKRVIDATGAISTYRTDLLGRVTEIATAATPAYPSPVGNAWARRDLFVYDAAANGIGMLNRAESNDGVVTGFGYDSAGRVASLSWTVGGTTRTFATTYDTAGRIDTFTYPALGTRSFAVRAVYGAGGLLDSIGDASAPPTQSIWQQISRTANGLSAVEQFADVARVERTYDAAGALRFVRGELLPSGTEFQRVSMRWDGDGLLKERLDLGLGVAESYGHDFFGRLERWTVSQNCAPVEWRYGYDDWGNLRTVRSSVTTTADTTLDYTQVNDAARPHAVKSVTQGGVATARAYDPAGQLTSLGSIAVTWTPFGLPRRIVDGARVRTFAYDAFGQRVLASDSRGGTSTSTLTVGGLYSEETTPSGTQATYSIVGSPGVVAQLQRDATSDQWLYIHPDHLGSPSVVTTRTTAGGAVLARNAYEPFGDKRHPWSVGFPPQAPPGPLNGFEFTGHASEPTASLVDMGGRIYDAAARRFASPDPLVALATSQGLNRYSYALNSPVSLVDPSGFQVEAPNVPLIPSTEPTDWVRIKPAPPKTEGDAPTIGICGAYDAGSGELQTCSGAPKPATPAPPPTAPTPPSDGGAAPARVPPPGMSLKEFAEWEQGWAAQSDVVREETRWWNFEFQEMTFGEQVQWDLMKHTGGVKQGMAVTGEDMQGHRLSLWERAKLFASGTLEAADVATTVVSGVGFVGGLKNATISAVGAKTSTLPTLPSALTVGRNADTGVDVYLGVVNGVEVYPGITNNLVRRTAQHADRFEAFTVLTQKSGPLLRGEARAVEEALIQRRLNQGLQMKTPAFPNKRHEISPLHPWYEDAVKWGESWLQQNGY